MIVDHVANAGEFRKDKERALWHDKAVWNIRANRDVAIRAIPEWEQLRERASEIKMHTLTHLDRYLEEFEKNAIKNGAIVHWARDAKEHNEIVLQLLKEAGATRIVKSKSMLTEEVHLNEYLHAGGIEVVDSDLGEFIVQVAEERPSHIVAPAIHKTSREVAELLYRKFKILEPTDHEPQKIVHAVRKHLRHKFLEAQAGITGGNFAVAETGTFVVCTNEGNADLGTSLPPLHIASIGIEKLIPKTQDLPVYLRLLARSATSQPITVYSSHFKGPRPGGKLHIILVDNGRTRQAADESFIRSLSCIRCGACLNTCPVYRRSGGHSYDYAVGGPIGIVLAGFRHPETHGNLAFASTLCGSCTNVCPVKIDLHEQILKLRPRAPKVVATGPVNRLFARISAQFMLNPTLYRWSGRIGRTIMRLLPKFAVELAMRPWTKNHGMMKIPAKSFLDSYKGESK